MNIRTHAIQALVLGLLLMAGCDALRNDLARLTSSSTASLQPRSSAVPQVRSRSPSKISTPVKVTPEKPPPLASSAGSLPEQPPVALAGKSEDEIRALLGTPTSEKDRSPGKQWRYQDGQCTYDVQLYRDVRTKQFATLAYEVKSDDSTNDGKRRCMAQLRSRVQVHP